VTEEVGRWSKPKERNSIAADATEFALALEITDVSGKKMLGNVSWDPKNVNIPNYSRLISPFLA